MRFLIDNALSPVLAVGLAEEGHDAVHVRDLALAAADGELVLQVAAEQDRVLVSADTDSVSLHRVMYRRTDDLVEAAPVRHEAREFDEKEVAP